jgi:adenylyltransferase/sulfurtransferase
VLGATTGIIGSMQAMEAIKLLAGIGDSLKGKLMVCDFRDMFFTTVNIFKRSDCPLCQVKPAKPAPRVGGERLAWLCGRNTVNVNPPRPIEVGLEEIYERLKRYFKVIIKSSLVVVFEYNGVEVSLFNRGRMLIKNVEDEESALRIYGEIMRRLGLNLA